MSSNTSSVKYVDSCRFSNALPRVTISFLNINILLFFLNMMVTCGNALKVIQICKCIVRQAVVNVLMS